jgi:2-methylisocitrate lyase-like PEP mutase family enzyme
MISVAEQAQLAETFRARHHRAPPLLLPNAWDGASARILAGAGFDMLATTSAGVAWSLGYADGEAAPWPEVVAATARIVRAGRCAVTADIEAGYAPTPEFLATRIAEVIGIGAVGVNLEDGTPGDPTRLLPLEEAAMRLRTARAAATAVGVPIVINARIDLFLASRGRDLSRFDEAIERGRAYLAAGADCLYPIGLSAPQSIARFVKALGAPVNLMAHAGGPTLAELEQLGVARVSTASGIAAAALGTTIGIGKELLETGRFDALASPLTYPEIQKLFA